MLNVSARRVSQNLSAHDRHWQVASSQELLVHTHVTKNCFVVVWLMGTNMWIYHWAPLSKSEFMQWKDVDCPTFTRICKSAINWLDYGNSFSGIQTDCLLHPDYLHPGETTAGQYMQNQHSSYSMSSSRNSDDSCHLGVWCFHDNAPLHKSFVAQQALCNCEFVQLNHPAYSLDLAPSNYFLIRNLHGTWFIDDESLKMGVKAWSNSQNRIFYFQSINIWEQKFKICTDVAREYVKKWQHVNAL